MNSMPTLRLVALLFVSALALSPVLTWAQGPVGPPVPLPNQLEFPSADSETSVGPLGAGGGGAMFIAGQEISETFNAPGIAPFTESQWVFSMSSCVDPTVVNTFDVFINGVLIGEYQYQNPAAGTVTIDFDLTFQHPAITGPDYTLTIVATSTVPPGLCSWNWFPDGLITFNGVQAPIFRRGDVNDDSVFDVSDMVFGLAALFIPGSPIVECLDAGDLNDDGAFDVSDTVYGLASLFIPGSPPPADPTACGSDTTPSAIACGLYESCP